MANPISPPFHVHRNAKHGYTYGVREAGGRTISVLGKYEECRAIADQLNAYPELVAALRPFAELWERVRADDSRTQANRDWLARYLAAEKAAYDLLVRLGEVEG